MFTISGLDASLWHLGEPCDLEVPLVTGDGWVWRPADECLRWWLTATVVDRQGSVVEAEHVTVRSGRVELPQACSGPLTALVTGCPLSLVGRWGRWDLNLDVRVQTDVMGPPAVAHGPSSAQLTEPQRAPDVTPASEGLVARLQHGPCAFQGAVAAAGNESGVTALFRQGVDYEPI